METISENDQIKMLDSDFMYYLSFSDDYHSKLRNANEKNSCQAWLTKLCSQSARGSEERKSRNLWLCNLVACIQRGHLTNEFLNPPEEGPLPMYPQSVPQVVRPPKWLDEISNGSSTHVSRDGRTYLATKKLDNERGTLAYLAVTLNDEEPDWSPQIDINKDKTYKNNTNSLGDFSQKDLATVLAGRKTLKQRKTVVEYYNKILQNIQGQLDGTVEEGSDDSINDLIVRLVERLKKENKYESLTQFEYRERYFRLLEILVKKIEKKLNRIDLREIVLDELENQVLSDSVLDETLQETTEPCKCADWQSKVSSKVSQERLKNIQYAYPPELLNDFLTLLEKEKLSLGERIRRNHVEISKQMNEEFRREQRAGEARCDVARAAVAEAEAALEVCKSEPPVPSPASRNLKKDFALSEALFERLQEQNIQLMKIVNKLSSFASTTSDTNLTLEGYSKNIST